MHQGIVRFIDLFAGLGGFHVGLARLGHECVLASEADEPLRRLYQANHGLLPDNDVRALSPADVPEHDLLCAGFPCQPFSKAGKQLGLGCNRDGDLFFHIVRLLKAKRPRWFILENVPNLEGHARGSTFRVMLDELRDAGYDVDHRVISPHDFGVPQIRKRLFIVGCRSGLNRFEWPQPTQEVCHISSVLDDDPEDASKLPASYEQSVSVWQEFLDRIPKTAGLPPCPIWSYEFGATYRYDGIPPASQDPRSLAKKLGSFGCSLKGLSHEERMARLPSYARSTSPFPKWKQSFIQHNRVFYEAHRRHLKPWLVKVKQLTPTLQKFEWNCKGEPRVLSEQILQFRASGLRAKRANCAPAIIAMTSSQIPVIPWESRYMTVRECARLQGLCDLSFDGLAESAAFRAIGNAVSADVVQLIANNLLGYTSPKRVTRSERPNTSLTSA